MRWECLHAQQLQQPLPATLQQAHTIIVMPSTDLAQAQRAAELMANRAAVDDALLLVVLDDAREGFVAIANRVYRATRSQGIGYVAQDAFAGRRRLQLALHTLLQHNKGLLGFNDGKWAGALAAFGLGQRRWLGGGGRQVHAGTARDVPRHDGVDQRAARGLANDGQHHRFIGFADADGAGDLVLSWK